jgi:hypothetical protein
VASDGASWDGLEAAAAVAGLRICACAGRDRIVGMLRSGDPTAIELAELAMPLNLPPRVVQAMRDRELRNLSDGLRLANPDLTVHRVALLLINSFSRVARGAALQEAAFDWMTHAEIGKLEQRLIGMSRWLRKFPAKGRLMQIISD